MDINDNTPLAFLTVGQLKDIIRKELARKEEPQKTKALKENMSPDEAVKMLSDNGYKITKQTLYHLTANRKIPHSKFGRTLLFSEKELIEWAAKKKTKQSQHLGIGQYSLSLPR